MAHRFILLDSLKSLNAGNLLIKGGETSFGYYLDWVPDVSAIAEWMIKEEWVVRTKEEGWFSFPEYYSITEKGYNTLIEGVYWYRSLPLSKKILGRTGFIKLEPL